MSEQLLPADIFLTRGHGWFSWAIRFFSRHLGEPRTKANHVGLIVSSGSPDQVEVIEALEVVRRHGLFQRYGRKKKGTDVAVYRPLNLSEQQKTRVVEIAESYVNYRYGWWKLVAHLLDWFLLGAYVFRRLTRDGRYPICSWIVAHAYEAIGKHFDVSFRLATPDDIHDFVSSHPEKYQQIRPFVPLAAPAATGTTPARTHLANPD